MIFSGFGEPVGSRFFASFLFFLGLRLSILRVSSEVCFLVGLGQKMMPGSVVGCAENIVNTMVFVRFHFFTYSVNWMISNRLLDVFLVVFLDTLGSSRLPLENHRFSDLLPRPSKIRKSESRVPKKLLKRHPKVD